MQDHGGLSVERTAVRPRTHVRRAPDPPGGSPAPPFEPGDGERPPVIPTRAGSVLLIPWVAVPALVGLVLGGWPLAIVSLIALAAARVVRRRTARLPFGFGDGFLAYRSTDGWPRGVQEEDGVHWSVGRRRTRRRVAIG